MFDSWKGSNGDDSGELVRGYGAWGLRWRGRVEAWGDEERDFEVVTGYVFGGEADAGKER